MVYTKRDLELTSLGDFDPPPNLFPPTLLSDDTFVFALV